MYIGDHYYCESGNTETLSGEYSQLFTDDLLWDGTGCLPEISCCYNAGMPWFFHKFPTTTVGNIEIRICHDQPFSDEGVVVEHLQLYIQ